MKYILKALKKAYHLFLNMPKRVRFLFVLFFFLILFAVSVNMKQNEYKNINNKTNIVENNGENGESPTGDNKDIVPILKEVVVVIDPGHGGEDLGAVKGDLYEKELNLDISLKMGELLENIGINVMYTRKKDIDVGLDERVNIANNIDATLFISVHNNYMPNDAAYKGTETLYCTPVNVEENKMDGQKFAVIVQNKLVSTLNTVNNGTIYRPNLLVLRKTNMPAVIAEVAYMSNSSDRAKLEDDDFRQKAAEALTEAIIEALEFMKAEKYEDGKWMIMN